jgi:hypothetical protein
MKIQKLVVYKVVADRLNEMGIVPYSARQWSQAMVQAVVYGKIKNEEAIKLVRNTLRTVMDEYYAEGKS